MHRLRNSIAAIWAFGALSGAAPAALAASPMGIDDARHLLTRTGFMPTPEQIRQFAALDYETGIDRILNGVKATATAKPPNWVDQAPGDYRDYFQRLRQMVQQDRQEAIRRLTERARELKNWWYEEMLTTDSPFTERMVLFWHNHFTSSLQKVRYAPAIYRQNVLYRTEALGNFARLLKAIPRDPAMLLYLDGATSQAGKPNENFARELLELFTLGEGRYGERDIKDAARAFTGWSLDRADGTFRFYPALHDNGEKSFLERSGNLDGDAVIEALLQQPRTAELVVEKLWREFISPTPEQAEVKRLAGILRGANYELKPLMRALLLSPDFRAPANRGTLVKSPVELLIGTLRFLQYPVDDKTKILRAARALGQDVLDPPNVKGWAGGNAWITSYTLLLRQQIMQRFIAASQVVGDGPNSMAMKTPVDREQLADMPIEGRSLRNAGPAMHLSPRLSGIDAASFERYVMALPPVTPIDANRSPGEALALLLLDPVYNLK